MVDDGRQRREWEEGALLSLLRWRIRQERKHKTLSVTCVTDPGCLSRIRILPSRIKGQKYSGSRIRIKEFKYI